MSIAAEFRKAVDRAIDGVSRPMMRQPAHEIDEIRASRARSPSVWVQFLEMPKITTPGQRVWISGFFGRVIAHVENLAYWLENGGRTGSTF